MRDSKVVLGKGPGAGWLDNTLLGLYPEYFFGFNYERIAVKEIIESIIGKNYYRGF